MFPYINRLEDYTSEFPAATFSPREFRNDNQNGEELTESGVIPTDADFEGRRRLNLDQVPLEALTVSVTVDGDERILVPYGGPVEPGQVGISFVHGALDFHEDDAGLPVSVDYFGSGTPAAAFIFISLAKEILVLQVALQAILSATGGNKVLATPANGSSGVASLRSLVAADIPSLSSIYQPLAAILTGLSTVTTAANKLIYATGSNTFATTDFTAAARTFLAAVDAGAQRTALGLVPGTDVQAFDAELAAIAGLTSAANKIAYFTGSGTAALADFTAAGRAIAGAADAAAQRSALGLVIGTDVAAQASLASYLPLSGGTMTGGLSFSGSVNIYNPGGYVWGGARLIGPYIRGASSSVDNVTLNADGSVSLYSALAITQGGTGATSAANARLALGFAAADSVANVDPPTATAEDCAYAINAILTVLASNGIITP